MESTIQDILLTPAPLEAMPTPGFDRVPPAEQPVQQLNASGMLWILALVIVLFVVISLLDRLKTGRKKQAPVPAKAPAGKPIEPNIPDDPPAAPIVAIITAAVAAILAGEQAAAPPQAAPPPEGFIVRSIRRSNHPLPAWNRAGIEEQVYSRL
jgi:hypothetical protein